MTNMKFTTPYAILILRVKFLQHLTDTLVIVNGIREYYTIYFNTNLHVSCKCKKMQNMSVNWSERLRGILSPSLTGGHMTPWQGITWLQDHRRCMTCLTRWQKMRQTEGTVIIWVPIPWEICHSLIHIRTFLIRSQYMFTNKLIHSLLVCKYNII